MIDLNKITNCAICNAALFHDFNESFNFKACLNLLSEKSSHIYHVSIKKNSITLSTKNFDITVNLNNKSYVFNNNKCHLNVNTVKELEDMFKEILSNNVFV